MSDDVHPLQELATEATGTTPTIGEVLAMHVLLGEAIREEREHGCEGLADLGSDFLRRYDDVEITLNQTTMFQREYLRERDDG